MGLRSSSSPRGPKAKHSCTSRTARKFGRRATAPYVSCSIFLSKQLSLEPAIMLDECPHHANDSSGPQITNGLKINREKYMP